MDGSQCWCNYTEKEVRADIFGVTGKLRHDTQPAHMSAAIAGNQASCQSSVRYQFLGRVLNSLHVIYNCIFLFCVRLEDAEI